jgi:hypothetical protein
MSLRQGRKLRLSAKLLLDFDAQEAGCCPQSEQSEARRAQKARKNGAPRLTCVLKAHLWHTNCPGHFDRAFDAIALNPSAPRAD